MPGLIALRRRWSVGSDDLIMPGVLILTLHLIWFFILSLCLLKLATTDETCTPYFNRHILVSLLILLPLLCLESCIVYLSMKGTTFYVRPRMSVKYILYTKGVFEIFCFLWAIVGFIWYSKYGSRCALRAVVKSTLGYCIFTVCMIVFHLILAWCFYDNVGRSFVKKRKLEMERNIRRTDSRVQRNQEQTLLMQREYHQKWQKRLRKFYHLAGGGKNQDTAFTEIAAMISNYFHNLDIVPSDILAGLMLLREDQKLRRHAIEKNPENNIITFMSGIPITPATEYLDFRQPEDRAVLERLHHYFRFAVASYGCRGYAMLYGASKCVKLIGCRVVDPRSSCMGRKFPPVSDNSDPQINCCCQCNYTALLKISRLHPSEIVYATFHAAVSKSNSRVRPFSFSYDYGLDVEGINLVGKTSSGLQRTNSRCHHSGCRNSLVCAIDQSGFCLQTSLSFQEEMDKKCMEKRDSQSGSQTWHSRLNSLLQRCTECVCGGESDGVVQAASSSNQLHSVLVWETPFFVALDHDRKKVVVAIRGTVSVSDFITDLCAETCPIPMEGCPPGFVGHKGMIAAALYIKEKLQEEAILTQAFSCIPVDGDDYELLLVGHSLGAGAAVILGMLLRADYPSLRVICFAPPGGLMSLPAAEYSKKFTTSLINGKDVVARVGLPQMEQLRSDLLGVIKRSKDPKWKIILGEVCCCCSIDPDNIAPCNGSIHEHASNRQIGCSQHPTSMSLTLTSHNPLYAPGKILQIVRNNPKREGLDKKSVGYYAIWRDQKDFSEVIISPVMVADHMPRGVSKALNKCYAISKLHKVPTWADKIVLSRPSISESAKLCKQSRSTSSSPSSCLNMRSFSVDSRTQHYDTGSPQFGTPQSSFTAYSTPHHCTNVCRYSFTIPETTPEHVSSDAASKFYSTPSSDPSISLRTSARRYSIPKTDIPIQRRQKHAMSHSSSMPTAYSNPHPQILARRSWGPGTLEELESTTSTATLVAPCQECALLRSQSLEKQRHLLGADLNDVSVPMASVETLTSMSSSSTFEEPAAAPKNDKAKNRLSTHSEGYCYYVYNDSDLSDSSPSNQNVIVTSAIIEAGKSSSDDTISGVGEIPLQALQRPESTHIMDRYGNVKGRTTLNDRYTLVYGSRDGSMRGPAEVNDKERQFDSLPRSLSSTSSTPNLAGYVHYCSMSSSATGSSDTLSPMHPGSPENKKRYSVNIEEALKNLSQPGTSTPRNSRKFEDFFYPVDV